MLTVINQFMRKLMDFSWGKMCVVNEHRINLKIEAFSPEAGKNIASQDEVAGQAGHADWMPLRQ